MSFGLLLDSYLHYRKHVGCGRVNAIYRAFYYEIKGKDPE